VAPRTPLDLATATALLARFGLAAPRALAPLPGGAVNSNYRVEIPTGPLFLRINEGKSDAEVAFEHRLIAHLVARGFPTPRGLPATDGAPFVRLPGARAGAQVSVFAWSPGRILPRGEVTADHARQVGDALARLHRAGVGLDGLPPGRYGLDAVVARLGPLAAVADAEVAGLVPELRGEAAWVAAQRRPGLPAGVIHQDLFRDNVLFDGDDLVAVLDLEQACGGRLVYDLMVAVLDWCFDDAFAWDRARALVAGYAARRPLLPVEREGAFVEARAAALRFTVTRLADIHLPWLAARAAGASTPPPAKDFRRYRARLEALRRLGAPGFVAALGW
jgi:homoserine kinase type II